MNECSFIFYPLTEPPVKGKTPALGLGSWPETIRQPLRGGMTPRLVGNRILFFDS
jgi:hypothetical protein